MNTSLTNIAVFASGTGTNAEKLIQYFNELNTKSNIRVALIVTNKANAGVVSIAHNYKVPVLIIEKDKFFNGNAYVDELKNCGIEFIVLAGFLWKIPHGLLQAYPEKIINIHPALLPLYGGKGMYGKYVHEAVLAGKQLESGITIHLVDALYDHGAPIAQFTCPVLPNDTVETLQQRIHQLEHQHYAPVVEQYIKNWKSTH